MLRRNGLVVKSVESFLRLERSLWWLRFVKEGGLEVVVALSHFCGRMHSGLAWFRGGLSSDVMTD